MKAYRHSPNFVFQDCYRFHVFSYNMFGHLWDCRRCLDVFGCVPKTMERQVPLLYLHWDTHPFASGVTYSSIFQLSVALHLPGFSGSNCGEVTFPGQHKFRGNRMHWGSGCTLVPYCSAVHGKFCKRRLPGFEMFQARNVLGGCCRKCIGRLWYIHHGL